MPMLTKSVISQQEIVGVKEQFPSLSAHRLYVRGDGHGQKVSEIIANNSLTIHFQPIFSAQNNSVYGYEALTRIVGDNPGIKISDLFKNAILTGTISSLDMKCRENAIRQASIVGINRKGSYLFINICSETLMDPAHRIAVTDNLSEKYAISKEKIILEITEESAVKDYNLFSKTIAYYKDRGYKIAIDDFGAGYGGLKMLSEIKPDFVKIDRYFISNIDKEMIKLNLVDSISMACHRIGIKVIAEGIEQEDELQAIMNMGIELFQGYLLGKPSPQLYEAANKNDDKEDCPSRHEEPCFIADIAHKVEPVHQSASITASFNRFIENPNLKGLPVVEDERVIGMLHRNRFLENQILGKRGYGMHLNLHKNAGQLVEHQFLMVEASATIEEVAQRVSSRKFELLYDDICVTKNGKYFGTVPVYLLLDAITQKSLILAKGANPLSGLPGNEFIQREIDKRITQNMPFDVCYIDINNFKPYNDHYGFEKGDIVIKSVACAIEDCIKSYDNSNSFAGHIGGDDFIVISLPQISMPTSEKIISDFKSRLSEFHGMEDYQKGFYISKNRKGEEERFQLLSLSIGIVSTEVYKIESYAHLASLSAEVKKAAKMQNDSSIVKDKRMRG